jgi:hypothetical protein
MPQFFQMCVATWQRVNPHWDAPWMDWGEMRCSWDVVEICWDVLRSEKRDVLQIGDRPANKWGMIQDLWICGSIFLGKRVNSFKHR